MSFHKEKILSIAEDIPINSLRLTDLALFYATLKSFDWCRTDTARKLGVGIRTVRLRVNLLKKYGIEVPDCDNGPLARDKRDERRKKEVQLQRGDVLI